LGGHDLVCAYLTGSLIYDQPQLGGITDIDMVYIHTADIPCAREIIPVTDEIQLDIAHYSQAMFNQPRQLRSDAWLGLFYAAIPSCCSIPRTGSNTLRQGLPLNSICLPTPS
jgi:hypothetical protein